MSKIRFTLQQSIADISCQAKSIAERTNTEKLKGLVRNAQEKLSITQSSTGFQSCVHHFGYLKNHPKNAPVPDECFGCLRILDCLFPNGSNLETPETFSR